MHDVAGTEESVVEHRRHARAISVMLVARVAGAWGDSLCLVRNVSPFGLMAEVPAPPRPGDPVTLELSSAIRIDAVVRWSRDNRFGVAFDREIDLLAALGEQRRRVLQKRDRAVRFSRDASARILTDNEALEAQLVDISCKGLCLAPISGRVASLLPVKVSLDGLPTLVGETRWATAGKVGVSLQKPLPYRLLASWLERTDGPACW